MHSLSLKIPPELHKRLAKTARLSRINQSELVRRALTEYLDQNANGPGFKTPGELAGDLAGSVAGGPEDLASNQDHLEDFGH
jgi:hypothetical protein